MPNLHTNRKMIVRFLVLCVWARLVLCEPYLVTKYVQVTVSTILDETIIGTVTFSALFRSKTFALSPTANPLPTPLNVVTSSTFNSYQGPLTIVQVELPANAGSVNTNDDYINQPRTNYYVALTYSQCSDHDTTRTAMIDVPTPISLSPITASTSFETYGTTPRPIISALVKNEDVDQDVLSSLSLQEQPYACSDAVNPSIRIRPDSSGKCSNGHKTSEARCGDDNPCCVSCSFYVEYCIGTCPPNTRHYYECKGGARFYTDAASGTLLPSSLLLMGAIMTGWIALLLM